MIGAAMMITVQREKSSSIATISPSRTAITSAIFTRRSANQRVSSRVAGAGAAGGGTAGGGTAGSLTAATLPCWGADPGAPAARELPPRAVCLGTAPEEPVDGRSGAADVGAERAQGAKLGRERRRREVVLGQRCEI